MQHLLRFTALLLHLDQLPMADNLTTTVSDLLQGVTATTLVSRDLAAWTDAPLPFPVLLRSPDHNATLSVAFGAFILDLRSGWDVRPCLRTLGGNADSKYVVIAAGSNEEAVRAALLAAGLCHAWLLTVFDGGMSVQKMSAPCRGVGDEVITAQHRCRANVSFMDFPPNVIFTGSRLEGYEGNMVQMIANHFHVTLEYVNRHESEWGLFDPPSGLQGDMVTGRSLMGFGAFYAFHTRWLHADLVFCCTMVRLSWVVPARFGRRPPTWFNILVSELSLPVWVSLLATYLALIPVAMLCRSKLARPSVSWPFHNLALVLGVPQPQALPRGLALAVIAFGFVVTSCYQSKMSSKLTAPAQAPEIRTLKELAESGLEIVGPPLAKSIVDADADANPDDLAKRKLSVEYKITSFTLDGILPRIVHSKQLTILRHSANIYHHANKDPRWAGRIHVTEEATLIFIPVVLMPKHSCLTRRFQQGFRRLCDSGLGHKWWRDLSRPVTPPRGHEPRRLTLEHIEGLLILLALGWAAASVSFLVEITRGLLTPRFAQRLRKTRARLTQRLRKNGARLMQRLRKTRVMGLTVRDRKAHQADMSTDSFAVDWARRMAARNRERMAFH